MNTYTIFCHDNPSRALVKIRTIQATDLETAQEAARYLIKEETNGIGIVLAVLLEDDQ